MRKLLQKSLLLLCALVAGSGSVWADYEEVYNLNCPKNGSNSAYASNYDVTISGITWNAPGNQNIDGSWRIGGKSISEVDRVITGKTAISSEVSKISFNHKGKSRADVTVPKVTLTVSSKDDFSTIIDEVVVSEPDITKGTAASFDFTPTSPLTTWPSGCYYKITINVSNSSNSNGGLDLTSIVFYKTVADKITTTVAIDDASMTNTDLKNGTAAGSLAATVKAGDTPVAGADVTWSSGNEDVATVDADGIVTLVATGTTTITATYDGDATYYGSSATYDLIVTDSRIATTTAIDATGITNLDVYTSTVAGKLIANVKAGDTPVDGATVTWESSDESVATVDAEGNVTLVKAGTTTITANYAGAGSYAASSGTYKLTVEDSNAPLLYESVSLYTSDSDSSTKITSSNKATYLDSDAWDTDKFTNAYPGKNGCFKLGTSSATGTVVTNAITLTGNGILTFQAKQYKVGENALTVSVTGATAIGDLSVTAGADFEEYAVYLSNPTSTVVITFTSTDRIYLDEIKLVKVNKEFITISSATWATFSSTNEVEIPAGVTAYYAQKKNGSTVTLKEITGGYIPANTGVVVAGAEGTYTANVTSTGATLGGTNLLKPWTTEGEPSEAGDYYTLAVDGSNNPVFKQSTGGTLAAGKAYLVLPAGGARELSVSFGGETTGIDEVRGQKEYVRGECFNLAGQRVAQPTRGLYIVNGRKVVIK